MKSKVLRYLRDRVIPPYKPTVLGSAIIDSMTYSPDNWTVDDHYATYRHINFRIWVANGLMHRRIEAVPEGMSVERANKALSTGDLIAIDELARMLRRRTPIKGTEETQTDELAAMLRPTEDK